MKKQRPTIPVSEWKIAVNLDATHDIQNQKGTPAYGCDCDWCLNWRSCAKEILPAELREQLLRAGIDLKYPTDLYQYENNKNEYSIRVVFHVVGKILNGPNQWQSNEIGKVLMYKKIREKPNLSLVVLPQKQTNDPSPVLKDKSSGDLIRIDFRLTIPSIYINDNGNNKCLTSC